jgi:trk system potassium uptake protein TrkA
MNIVICGSGEVGRHSAEVLAEARHDVTVIDQDERKLDELDEVLDVRSLTGNGTQADVLLEAGCANADLFIAATNVDEINLLAASVAKGVGAVQCIARVHHSAFYEQRGLRYTRHLGIDHLVCPEASTATAIASTLRSPGATAVEQFARGKVEMQQLAVNEDSRAIGVALKQLKLPGPALLAAIERQGEAFIPGADTEIHAGDNVTIIGDAKGFEKITKMFHAGAERRRRVMIMGGSTMGVWLCRALRHRIFSVRLFEADEDRALELSEKLNWVTLLKADVINTDALQDERVDLADVFIAMTNDDERNILAAARAKSMGVKSAIAVLQRPTYMHLLEHVGIDRAFSPRSTAVNEIIRHIDTSPVRPLATLARDIAHVYEARVTDAATKVVGNPLREVRFPARCIIAAIQRGDDVRVPGAEDTIEPGDTVIVIGPADSRKELNRVFGGALAGGLTGSE